MMNLTLEEAKAMMTGLGQRFQTTDEEDAFLYEEDAEQLIYEFLISNNISLPQTDLEEFDCVESDADWHETLGNILEKMAQNPQYKASLPREFVSLAECFIQSFGWGDEFR